MTINAMVDAALRDVPNAVAAGIVDLRTGTMLSLETIEEHPQEVLDFLAPATRELFEGPHQLRIERALKQHKDLPTDEPVFQEILIGSRHLWHYFGRMASEPNTILTIVARADANLGLFLVKAREISRTGEF